MAREPLPTEPPEPPPCPPGWRTGPPDFVGVGAQRCGTSWWFTAIRSHPRVGSSPLGKEIHYFSRFWAQAPPPDLAAGYGALFPRPEGCIIGEWTPSYMADLSTIRLLRDAAPEARILVILRDPVERYRSGLARFRRRAAEDGEPRYRADYSDAVWRGMYASQLERVFEYFPRERVLVLQYERCVREPVGELARTFRFLGVGAGDGSGAGSALLSGRPPGAPPPSDPFRLHEAVREDLVDRLRTEVERLVKLCPEIEVSLWPNFSDSTAPLNSPRTARG